MDRNLLHAGVPHGGGSEQRNPLWVSGRPAVGSGGRQEPAPPAVLFWGSEWTHLPDPTRLVALQIHSRNGFSRLILYTIKHFN